MALILNKQTGLVSPQFQVKFDGRFQTINDISTESFWQTKTGSISTQHMYDATPQELISQNNTVMAVSEGVNTQDNDLPPKDVFTMPPESNTPASEGVVASEESSPESSVPEREEQPGINKRKNPSVLN